MKKQELQDCLDLNIFLKKSGLVKLTWGNASVLLDSGDLMAIKPSGVCVDDLSTEQLSIIDVKTSDRVSGLKQSVDTDIHLEIYKKFPDTKYMIHNHSKFATSFAQAGMSIPILGTTHADYFPGDIPIIPSLEPSEYAEYESNLGKAVVRKLIDLNSRPSEVRAVLLENHGVLLFSNDLKIIKESAIVLEEIAEMAYYTIQLNNKRIMLKKDYELFSKHFERKNGKNKYYGQ